MSTVVKDLGAVSAYAYAVEKGYTGTEAEFAELMADYAEVGQRAEDAADSALESKTAAQTAATTATNKASEATTAAQTATTKAGEASTSASTATSAKDTAVSASQTATTKATEATTAAATATSAATTATTAKDDAVSAKTAAQTAQTGAETAAASVQSSAAQIQTNADDISELKEDLSDVNERLDSEIGDVKSALGTLAIENDVVLSGWESGYIRNTNGTVGTDNQYCTSGYLFGDGNTYDVITDAGFVCTKIAKYNSSKAFVEISYNISDGTITKVILENDCYYRVQIKKDHLATLSPSSVEDDSVYFARYEYTDKTLLQSGKAADSKTVGDVFSNFYLKKTESGKVFRVSRAEDIIGIKANANVAVGNQNILVNTMTRGEDNPIVDGTLTYYKNTDGSVRVYGTAPSNINIWINTSLKVPKGIYTLSGCPVGGSATTYRLVCNYSKNEETKTWLIDNGSGYTKELSEDMDCVKCAVVIFKGTQLDETFYPQLEYGPDKSDYVKASNGTLDANTDLTITDITTVFSNSTFNLQIKEFAWGETTQLANDTAKCVDSIEKTIEQNLHPIFEKESLVNFDDYSFICVHHDNFSREMTGWEIGMNAGGTDVGNNYDWVTPSNYDDGLVVDNGATFEEDATRTNNFSLRKIVTAHASDFVIETNTPVTSKMVSFAYNVKDINNFVKLSIYKNITGYTIYAQNIVGGRFGDYIFFKQINNCLGEVTQITIYKQVLYLYIDDALVYNTFIGDAGDYLYLCGYRNETTHFDFVNIFNIANRKDWNPNFVLDSGEADVPLIVTSANTGGYELQDDVTRWSKEADHFVLNASDPLVHNGHRSERGIANYPEYTGNLRHLHILFDVYFPSTSVDTEHEDIFIQMHDRDGAYRAYVPFILNYDNNDLKVSLSSTLVPKAGVNDVIRGVTGYLLKQIITDKWYRVEIELKERYEEKQHPFTKIKINDELVFESHEPNCYNDLLGSSPQYGIYKNEWGTGVETFERYFDNLKISY